MRVEIHMCGRSNWMLGSGRRADILSAVYGSDQLFNGTTFCFHCK